MKPENLNEESEGRLPIRDLLAVLEPVSHCYRSEDPMEVIRELVADYMRLREGMRTVRKTAVAMKSDWSPKWDSRKQLETAESLRMLAVKSLSANETSAGTDASEKRS